MEKTGTPRASTGKHVVGVTPTTPPSEPQPTGVGAHDDKPVRRPSPLAEVPPAAGLTAQTDPPGNAQQELLLQCLGPSAYNSLAQERNLPPVCFQDGQPMLDLDKMEPDALERMIATILQKAGKGRTLSACNLLALCPDASARAKALPGIVRHVHRPREIALKDLTLSIFCGGVGRQALSQLQLMTVRELGRKGDTASLAQLVSVFNEKELANAVATLLLEPSLSLYGLMGLLGELQAKIDLDMAWQGAVRMAAESAEPDKDLLVLAGKCLEFERSAPEGKVVEEGVGSRAPLQLACLELLAREKMSIGAGASHSPDRTGPGHAAAHDRHAVEAGRAVLGVQARAPARRSRSSPGAHHDAHIRQPGRQARFVEGGRED